MSDINTQHYLSAQLAPLGTTTLDAMWQLFVHIGKFWRNLDDSPTYQPLLYSFMANRIDIDPLYQQYYATAQTVIAQLIQEHGQESAYTFLFTDASANQPPALTPLTITRQKVSNEFVALQLSLGGFKSFGGALNYPGYFGGANVPGAPAPYRSF
ncbi:MULTISPECIES: hypothetical protein [Dickeya]|uniref:hypothetical protein n=1 Tax=Dickeya TaxID=204037 RepID=UPI0003A103D7|nr:MULTISPECIES: hypothetical protein [Dickeya]WKV52474.1 hypothetical protein PL145_09810 [Dickeya fangzhongdai]